MKMKRWVIVTGLINEGIYAFAMHHIRSSMNTTLHNNLP